MARIAGVDLPRGKRIEIALTYIYGLGRTSSQRILSEAGVDWDLKSDDLTEGQITGIRKIIDEEYKVADQKEIQKDLSDIFEKFPELKEIYKK